MFLDRVYMYVNFTFGNRGLKNIEEFTCNEQ